jgi:hypothetical protein
MRNWKDLEGSAADLTEALPRNFLGGFEENHNSRSTGRDSKQAHPEHGSKELPLSQSSRMQDIRFGVRNFMNFRLTTYQLLRSIYWNLVNV